MKRLHELDLAEALLFGLSSTWKRILLFFLACWFGVFVGRVCDLMAWPINHGSSFWEFITEVAVQFIVAPWNWLGAAFVGFDGAGFLMFPVLCAALLMVLYMEVGYGHGVFLVLFTQPIHALWLESRFDDWKRYVPSWLFLAVYLAGVVWLYVRFLRRSRGIPE